MKYATNENSKISCLFTFILGENIIFAQKTKTRKVKAIESISLSINAKVYITQNNSTSVKIKGDTNDLEKISILVENSDLKIKSIEL